ncbi:Hypothetical predicted protein, partial [Olea europaea subsp. europaea]
MPPMSSWQPNLPFIGNYGASCSANEATLNNTMLQMSYRTQDHPLMGKYVKTSDNVGTFSYAAPDPVESANNSFTTNFGTIPDHLEIMPTGLDEKLPEVPSIEVD